MICKPMNIIKSKRSRSSFRNTLEPRKSQIRADAKNWQHSNSFVSLNKLLTTLNDDTLKKYNSETAGIDRYADLHIPTPINENKKQFQKSLSRDKLQVRTSSQFQSLEPEPWFNDKEIKRSRKSSKTNNFLNSSDCSFQKNSSRNISLSRGVLNASHRDRLKTDTAQDKHQRSQKFYNFIEENEALKTQNFTYTNQQKAKVSIQYLLHEQKHKKIEKILKYKRHLIDKPGLKQQKINQHSKYLVEMLKKLSKDNLFSKSFVDSDQKNKKSNLKKDSFKTINHETQASENMKQMKSVSCCNLAAANQAQTTMFRKRTKPTCSIKELKVDFKEDFECKQQRNYKMTFKPKRNWIFDKKNSSFSERTLKPSEIKSIRKLSDKQFAVTNHFLKIKKVKS